nr:MAG TPA: hypothetical protein [Caudoviricetes sp.]
MNTDPKNISFYYNITKTFLDDPYRHCLYGLSTVSIQ